MTKYEVSYISGNSLKYKIVPITANDLNEAVDIAFKNEGENFENRLVSVTVIEEAVDVESADTTPKPIITKVQYESSQKKASKLIKARNRACSLINDAVARYVKEKTRARSKKAAMEKDALLKSSKYKVLNDYERKEDIQDAYGYDFISASERDRLEDLWDEREELRNNKDENGIYSDEVTKALNEAYIHIADIWEDEITKLKKTVKEYEDLRDEEVRAAAEYGKTLNNQYNSLMTGSL